MYGRPGRAVGLLAVGGLADHDWPRRSGGLAATGASDIAILLALAAAVTLIGLCLYRTSFVQRKERG
ncbi:hypothetical protein GCM10009839_32440 [Catenulispora yoronensis]|uniref:LPXTG cell wall anchor domain-containing protein n=1 Tax=Catenulispora yoronensis TaxID=450799 RepID=A0ABP5FMX5_9ACTN